jgi:tetratricopeptide (TPR) repeat protein
LPQQPARDRLAALVLVGELEHAAGRPQAAIDPYQEALALLDAEADAEQRALLQTNLGLALLETGRSEPAVTAFEQALRGFEAPELAAHPVREQAEVGLAQARAGIARR